MNNLRARKQRRPSSTLRKEAGVALFAAIIALLLVTAVAAGMIILSNTEINVDANYRDEQVALFAAKAGLQEGRDRALAGNANRIALPAFLPGGAGSYASYIIASGVSPSSGSSTTNTYYDAEFANELNGSMSLPSGSGWYTSYATNSSYSGPSSNPVPYQWVRVNLKVDRSAYNSGTPYYVDGSSSNGAKQVCYDSVNQHEVVISAASCSAASSNYQPVYDITSFAVTPNGTHRMLQDEVTPMSFNLNFPAALTIPGQIGDFKGATSMPYHMNGNDGAGSGPAIAGWTANAPAVPAIGVSSGNDAAGTQTNLAKVDGSLPRPDHYTGSCASTPCVSNVTLNMSLSSPTNLDQILPLIQQSASSFLQPSPLPANGVSTANYGWSDVTGAMPGGTWTNPSTNPQIIYVDGNFDLGPNTGSGILVVTGNFTYHGNSGWNGIILVVGDGTTTFLGEGGGTGEFDGAVFVATTRDASGNQLSNFGIANFDISGGGGNGIYYNSCWIKSVQKPVSYQLLSSKEISH
jgi:Tfp pilus assembly protein PilX